MSGLLPCPFCGGTASRSEGRLGTGEPWHYIECEDCAATGDNESAWNTRLSTPASDDWRPIAEVDPKTTPLINVRSVTTYRWLPYSERSLEYQRGMKGRWQIADEHSWHNERLPEGGEYTTTPAAQ